jgi:DNA polymerase III delta subunit
VAKAREPEPWSELESLAQALERGALARGYALRGEERYFRERVLALVRAKAEAAGHEVCVHDVQRPGEGGDFQLARLVDDLSGGGLFAPKRLVVVRNPGELLKKVEGEDGPLVRAALAFVRSAEDVGTLVVSDSGLRADHALVKAIVAAGGPAPAFRRLYDTPPAWRPDPLQAELVQWTARRARELGLRLIPEQALYVSAATGNDLAALDDQLELLRASGGRELRSVVSWTAGSTPWAVADHVLAGDLGRALSGIQALYQGGFQEKSGKRLLEPAALGAMLVNALARGASACLAPERSEGAPVQRAALAERARKRPPAAWRALLEESATLERELKSGAELDASDFTTLALRWSLAGAPRPAEGQR